MWPTAKSRRWWCYALQRRQDELERKAQELARREEELKNAPYNGEEKYLTYFSWINTS